MKQNLLFVATIIFLPIVAFFAVWIYVLCTPANIPENGQAFFIKPGTGLHAFSSQLEAQGIIGYAPFMTMYGHLQLDRNLKSGEYLFAKGSTPVTIWSQVVNGTGLAYRPFAIIPGWSFTQLKQALAQADSLRHLTKDMSDKQIMQQLGTNTASGEGQFYPETYNYTRGESDLVILKRAYDLMQSRLQDAWANRGANLPYHNSYEALIAASLIEKEAFLSAERPIIAGVIVNRLSTKMPLQIDPTIVFALGDKYAGKIYKADLAINSPYNTYLNRGLPPTPIAMPSQSSLLAAMRPQPSNYFYYVAKGDGSHQFSENLIQHNAAVAVIMKQNNFTKDTRGNEHLQDLLELNNDSRQVH